MAGSIDKLSPSDPRVEHRTAEVNGKTYHYLFGTPTGADEPVGTVLLIHGFPDLSLGWRYQIPMLLSLGYRVIAPDMLGYGRTDAPEPLAAYSSKSMCDDMADLVAAALGPAGAGERVVLGGHDWGGWMVWRLALWRPELASAVFSVCTPFSPPQARWASIDDLTAGPDAPLPNLRYQVQLAGPEVEARVAGRDRLRGFLAGMYGAATPAGEFVFDPTRGVLFDVLDRIDPAAGRLLLEPEELEFYVDEFERNGMRGPLNWYRTRRMNYEEELALVEQNRIRIAAPSMMVVATKDVALLPKMALGQERFFDNLVVKEVESSHWALWQTPEQTNAHIREFLTGLPKDGQAKVRASI